MKKTQRRDGFIFPSPVAGSINSHSPTSGDVHLYADPGTYHTQLPRLYADCEGIDGGEKIPAGAQCQQNDTAPSKSGRVRSGSINTQSIYGMKPPKKLRKAYKSVKRDVQWANTPDRCKREFFVKNLYPRVLYAFSEIVVFVLRNDRLIQLP
jgi:hypothetical protein